jgi:hypothetical protein
LVKLTQEEQQLVRNTKLYQTELTPSSRGKWQGLGELPGQYPWFDLVDSHLIEQILPEIRTSGDLFVEHWPTWIIWGERRESSLNNRENDRYILKGSYGTGYLCLSLRNLVLVSLGEATECSPFLGPEGVAWRGGLDMSLKTIHGYVDERQPLKEDRVWRLPWESISKIEPTDHVLHQWLLLVESGEQRHMIRDTCIFSTDVAEAAQFVWSGRLRKELSRSGCAGLVGV